METVSLSVVEPQVYIVGRPCLDDRAVQAFLEDEDMEWVTDVATSAEAMPELAGRICYMAFGDKQGRKDNASYLGNIIESRHGSVLEHSNWNFILTGLSRSLTHELVRHRAGFGFSQLSQRYVDESACAFVMPPDIAGDAELEAIWSECVAHAQKTYGTLTEKLAARIEAKHPDLGVRDRRKMARQAARSVLPNSTETKMFLTANARALRHFIELRGNMAAEVEIRRLAVTLCKLLQGEAPNIFGDMEIVTLPDGTEGINCQNRKV